MVFERLLSVVYAWVFLGSAASAQLEIVPPLGLGNTPLANHVCDIEVPGQVFCDDFTDGDARDGEPVSWQPLGNTKASIEENNLIVTGNIPFDNLAIVQGVNLADVSIRARVRLGEESAMGVAVRDGGVRRNGGCNYAGWIDAESAVDVGNAGLNIGCSLEEIGEAVPLDFDVSEQDTMLQLDVFGDSIRLWVWPAEKIRPIEPLVSGRDSSLLDGEVALWSADKDASEPNPTHSGKGIFRYVQVATEPITLGISFDCNGDGLTDIFDANCATADDLDETLETAGLLPGDLDGNRLVEFLDFLVLADNFGMLGGYTQGDVDKSGQVDFNDFLILTRNIGQGSVVAAAVPEPSALELIVLGLHATLRRLRRFSSPRENRRMQGQLDDIRAARSYADR